MTASAAGWWIEHGAYVGVALAAFVLGVVFAAWRQLELEELAMIEYEIEAEEALAELELDPRRPW